MTIEEAEKSFSKEKLYFLYQCRDAINRERERGNKGRLQMEIQGFVKVIFDNGKFEVC